jgi:hypothetical protein
MVTSTQQLTPAQQLQFEAREKYRQSLQNERPLNGAELGDAFGRGERWGQKRIEEVHNAALINTGPSEQSEPDLDMFSLPPVTPPNTESEPGAAEPKRKWLRMPHRQPKVRAPKSPRPRRERPEPVYRPQRRGASGAGIPVLEKVSSRKSVAVASLLAKTPWLGRLIQW